MLERYRYIIATAGILLLLAPRLPGIGEQVNGAYLGVKIGPISFQPAEFAKIAIVVFLASYLRENREVLIVGARRVLGVTLPPLKHFGPMLVVWGASMFLLVFIRDLGSSLMFFAAFLALLYVATGALQLRRDRDGPLPRRRLVHRRHRPARPRAGRDLAPPLQPTPQASGYQILQSIFAQADGGLFGKGFGQGLITIPGDPTGAAAGGANRHDLLADRQRARPLRRLRADRHLPADRRPRLQDRAARPTTASRSCSATGLTAVFAVQAFVIIGGVTRVIPLTGVTLPFVSYGGSSIVANFVLLALLLLISDRARREAEAEPRGPRARRTAGGGGVNRQIIKLFAFIIVLFAVLVGFTVLVVGLRREGTEGKRSGTSGRSSSSSRSRAAGSSPTTAA